MKLKNLLMTTLFLLLLLSACANDNNSLYTDKDSNKDYNLSKKQYIIGVSFPTTELVYRAKMKSIAESVYPQGNTNKRAQLIIFDGRKSQEKQNEDLLTMITSGMDGIVLIPWTTDGPLSMIRYANDIGVPVITVDNSIDEQSDCQVISYVGADHRLMGEQAAELFIEALENRYPDEKQWNVIQLTGVPGSSGAIDRGAGIEEVLGTEERIILLGNYNAEFTSENAKSVTEDLLVLYDNIHGIICQNDLMAEGCYEAVSDAGKLGEIVIVGIDGQKSVVEKMVSGGIQGTVIQYPTMIETGIELLCDYLDGKKIKDVYYQPTDKIYPFNAKFYLDNDLAW